MEQKGIEPLTSSLRTNEPELKPTQSQEFTDTPPDAYTEAYIENPDSVHFDAPGEDFATALAMIERLSLGDDEKADAVRRLMAQDGRNTVEGERG